MTTTPCHPHPLPSPSPPPSIRLAHFARMKPLHATTCSVASSKVFAIPPSIRIVSQPSNCVAAVHSQRIGMQGSDASVCQQRGRGRESHHPNPPKGSILMLCTLTCKMRNACAKHPVECAPHSRRSLLAACCLLPARCPPQPHTAGARATNGTGDG